MYLTQIGLIMRTVYIPISDEDSYILDTFNTARHLRAFNRNLRGISVPVGAFHQPLHDQAIYDTDPSSRSDISHLVNLFSVREPRYKANVLSIDYCEDECKYMAKVEWDDRDLHPLVLRLTAVMRGKRCIRVLQFGVM